MIQAIKSPAVNARSLEFIGLKDAGAKAISALKKLLTDNNGTLPPIGKLLKLKGDAAKGKPLFHGRAICSSCHVIECKG